jgi:DoxX-like family
MQPTLHTTDSTGRVWAGRIILALPVLFLVFDTVIKLARIAPVVESFEQLGYPASLALAIGLIELACIAIFLVPHTSILGAILLTGYLGGAVATHVRIGSPLFSHVLFPVYVGALIWAGLYLRESRLRALISLKSRP